MLALIDKGLWTYHQDLKLLGINTGTRMTLIEVGDGELLAISPIKMTDSVLRQIEAAGKIKWIIAPNPFHHIYVNGTMRAFPEAVAFAPRSLIVKRQDIHFQGVIEKDGQYPWQAHVEYFLFEPKDSFSEVFIFHTDTQTLVVTDFIFNLKPPEALLPKLLAAFNKMYGRPRMTRLMRMTSGDIKHIHEAVAQIKRWNPKRLILAHGDIIEGDIPKIIDEALSDWL